MMDTDHSIYTGWDDYEFGQWNLSTVNDHILQFKDQIAVILSLEPQWRPTHINCHTGCDSFTFEEAIECFESILEECSKVSIPISHETHRSRILASPWTCLRMIEKFPDLRITLDLSHWNVVSERLLPINVLEPLFPRVDHIHARIGTTNSAQVGNPRAKYSDIFTKYHEEIWKAIWKRSILTGRSICSVTPEYGPMEDYYMPQMAHINDDGLESYSVEVQLSELIIGEQKKLEDLFKSII